LYGNDLLRHEHRKFRSEMSGVSSQRFLFCSGVPDDIGVTILTNKDWNGLVGCHAFLSLLLIIACSGPAQISGRTNAAQIKCL
jgi:hypothetical protein